MEAFISTFGVDWRLIIVQAVNFFILAGALTWLLYKPIIKMVAERERVVARGVEDAAEAKRKLDRAADEATERLRTAEGEAEDLVKRARVEAASEKTDIIKNAGEQAARLERDAEARAKEASARILRESESEIARLAILAAEKAIHGHHHRSSTPAHPHKG
jgi:F-type H+-transporting ATPase subunit b